MATGSASDMAPDDIITVHVTCGGLKKLVTAKKANIETEIRKIMVADHDVVSVQYYDKGWGDWIDITFDDIEANMKLQIVQKIDLVIPVQGDSADLSGGFDMSNTSIVDSADLTTGGASFLADTSAEEDNRSILSTSTVDYCILTKNDTSGKKPWSSDYRVPKEQFSKKLRKHLETEHEPRPLGKGQKSELFGVLYNDLNYNYGIHYPGSSQKKDIASALCALYPCLRSTLPGSNPTDTLYSQIGTYFRNAHYRGADSDVEEVVAKKKKTKTTQKAATSATGAESTSPWSLPNFLPMSPPGENEATIAKHKEWMKAEATKKNMDQTKMKVLMDRTFADRRRLVVTEGYSVQQIKEQYPSLFTAKEFAEEYYRISDRYLHEFDLALVTKGGRILQIPAKGKTKEDLQRLTDDSEVIQASLIKLACLLKEDVSWLVAKEEKAPKTPFPHIIADGDILDSKEYRLVADDTEFLVVGSLAEAVKLMMASYYIFNINYPPPIKCTLIFLQRVFLGVLDDQKLPMKLHTLSDKMERVA